MVLCFFGASGFWRRAATSLLRDADRSAACSSGGGTFVRRARHAVVQTRWQLHLDRVIFVTVHMILRIRIL